MATSKGAPAFMRKGRHLFFDIGAIAFRAADFRCRTDDQLLKLGIARVATKFINGHGELLLNSLGIWSNRPRCQEKAGKGGYVNASAWLVSDFWIA